VTDGPCNITNRAASARRNPDSHAAPMGRLEEQAAQPACPDLSNTQRRLEHPSVLNAQRRLERLARHAPRGRSLHKDRSQRCKQPSKHRARLIHTARRPRAHNSGTVLPIVLLISAMMLTTSAAWFEISLAAARGANNVRDYLQAFHAADSALILCARGVAAAATVEPAPAASLSPGEPTQWKHESAFEAGAVAPIAQWPGSVRPPQCLTEAWRLATRADARAYLLTSRGFGRTKESQVWLQMELVITGEQVERHWRRIAARPF
jgi:hypothetical protein